MAARLAARYVRNDDSRGSVPSGRYLWAITLADQLGGRVPTNSAIVADRLGHECVSQVLRVMRPRLRAHAAARFAVAS